MQKNKFLLWVASLLLIMGCSSSDDDSSWEEQPSSTVEGAYDDECRWVYSTMNHYYYWREDLPDSLDCNYTLDPVTFYKSLLSKKDRFSHIERNSSYTRSDGIKTPFYDIWPTKDNEEWMKISLIGNSEDVLLDSIYIINDYKVGYLCYLKFGEVKSLIPSIEKLFEMNIDELVLDLRYNPGGLLVTSRYLATSIAPDSVYNQAFQVLQYNHRVSQELFREKGDSLTRYSFLQPTGPDYHLGTPLYGLNLRRVYILVSNRTASASEVMITCLRPYMDVIVIGERTVGKGVGMNTFSDSRYKYSLVPITFRYYNARMESTPDEGIDPDYEVPGGYSTPRRDIGRIDEPLLAKALELILEEENPDSIETTNN